MLLAIPLVLKRIELVQSNSYLSNSLSNYSSLNKVSIFFFWICSLKQTLSVRWDLHRYFLLLSSTTILSFLFLYLLLLTDNTFHLWKVRSRLEHLNWTHFIFLADILVSQRVGKWSRWSCLRKVTISTASRLINYSRIIFHIDFLKFCLCRTNNYLLNAWFIFLFVANVLQRGSPVGVIGPSRY